MSKAERTRQYIVEKTAPIFNTKGYAGTSLTDMTEATGLTKGSIYGNFANKDEVALASFDYNHKKVIAIIQQEMEKEKTMKGKLLVYANVYENFMKLPFPKGGCPLLNTATEADDTHPQLREKVGDAITSWKNKLVAYLKEGAENKEFKMPANPDQWALTMIATIEGAIMLVQATGKLNYRKLVLQSVEKMILDL
ncbi:TetR family transcriptional regulator [Chitinophaga oryziterrae]|uniref:TetR family transcriptional regulator n=1 Tax=Chitinophaga oryziterrae TaxID=1031224 RepID=A0A6N8J7X4_9BACT|nr:TetR/AcrR family transcriptional regulator [Chitinophaga oryziterrae]MVT40376.1 TetR family transcriptional regulator [Chitinophaga oryziterrae]